MTFRPFRRRRAVGTVEQDTGPLAERRAWVDSGVAAEVEAFLAGVLVDHLAGHRQAVPTWAALNRLAHADHSQLVRLVGGAGLDPLAASACRVHAWAEPERFVAAQMLATDGATPEGLWRLQRDVLVPTELSLIDRTRGEALTAAGVMDIAMEAVRVHRVPDHGTRGDPSAA
ncbi:MAG TPA: hypothetical protein VKA65_18345 [Acidimicrobiales bacterium]|nr:hypothetical protein [Acidimicrobiales bacterium]